MMNRTFLKRIMLTMIAATAMASSTVISDAPALTGAKGTAAAAEPTPEKMRGVPPVESPPADTGPNADIPPNADTPPPADTGPNAEPEQEANPEVLASFLEMAEAFDRAVNEYHAHLEVNDWRARVGTDRRLLRAAGKLPPEYLAGRLDASPGNLEIATAVAVCLGEGRPDDSPQLVAGLLCEMLRFPLQRVRYRAAEAITQRIQDGTMPPGIEEPLAAVLNESLRTETNRLNSESMKYALKLLRPELPAR